MHADNSFYSSLSNTFKCSCYLILISIIGYNYSTFVFSLHTYDAGCGLLRKMLSGPFQKTIPARFCVKQTSWVLPGKTGNTLDLYLSLNLKESDENSAITILDTLWFTVICIAGF